MSANYTLDDSLELEDPVSKTKGAITGNLYLPNSNKHEIGIVLGGGILGSRWGIHDIADRIVSELEQPLITLDPPPHFKNKQDFRFGNYATSMRIAVQYLRNEYGVERFVGGGHSGGAIASLFANMGYSKRVEDIVINYMANGMPYSQKELEEALAEFNDLPKFDGLVIAALPRDVRGTIPGYAFNPLALKILHGFFLLQNRGGKTPYLGKDSERPYQWKQISVQDLEETNQYVAILQRNPVEYLNFLQKVKEEASENLAGLAQEHIDALTNACKLFIVPGKDINNFGPKVLVNSLLFINYVPRAEIEFLKTAFDAFIGENDAYLEFPRAAHFLNSSGKFEADSLFGLQAPEVQDKVIRFIKHNFLGSQ